VFKNSTEWKKLEVVKSNFYTDFFDGQSRFFGENSDFSKNGPSQNHRISVIFEKANRIFKP
jgi:hypothetical protein